MVYNNYPTYSPDGQSSSLRAAGAGAAAAATTTTLVSSSSSSNNDAIVSGGCRTTGSVIPYNGGHQTFGEPLSNLDFKAPSYATRSWQDKDPTKFDEAWQACAKQCNYEQKCHTYTVFHTHTHFGGVSRCYLHDPYKADYILDIPSKGYQSNHVSGVCRLN